MLEGLHNVMRGFKNFKSLQTCFCILVFLLYYQLNLLHCFSYSFLQFQICRCSPGVFIYLPVRQPNVLVD